MMRAPGIKFTYEEIPENLKDIAHEWREKMVEAVAEASEELLEKVSRRSQQPDGRRDQDGFKKAHYRQ